MTKRLVGLVFLSLLIVVLSGISTFAATKLIPPTPGISGSLTVCTGNSTTITASITPSNPDVIFRWYMKVGILYLHTFDGNPFITGPLLLNTDYYVEAYNTVTTEVSVPNYFTVSVVPLNIDVVAATPADLLLCNGDSTVFTATSVLGNTVFEWHDALIGGNLLYTGNPYQSGPLTTVPNLYVSSLNAGGCESPRIPAVTPVVLPAVDVPLVTPALATVCSGQTTTFTASSLLGSVTFNWYTNITGGTPIASGDTFTPDPENNNGVANLITLYYVEVVDGNGCSSIRVPVTMVTTPAIDLPIVNPIATTVCNGDSTIFTGSSLLGSANYFWYDSIIGGSLLFSGNPFNTGAISNNGTIPLTYTVFLEVRDSNGCASLRTPGVAVVTPALDLPIVSPITQTVCSGDSVTFTALSLLGDYSFFWYDSLLGGNLLATGSEYTTGALSNAGPTNLINTVYLEVRDSLGCASLRTPGTAIVTPLLAVPIVNPLIETICTGDSAIFVASTLIGVGGETYRWYDALTGGVLLHTGDTFSTGLISNSGTLDLTRLYYVSVEDTMGCSSLRTPATVIILPAVDLPIVSPPATVVCSGTSATFQASSLLGSVSNYYWYTDIAGGTPIDSGAEFNTGTLYNTTVSNTVNSYFVEILDSSGCRSLRSSALAMVTPAVNAPLIAPLTAFICSGNSVSFTASSILTADQKINWYDSINGVIPIYTGESFNTGPLVQQDLTDVSRVFYAEIEDSLGCRSLRAAVTVQFTPLLSVPVVDNPVVTICNGDSATFTVSDSLLLDSNLTYYWYDSINGGTLLHVGPTFNTGAIYSTGPTDLSRIFYVEVRDTAGCKSLRTPATVIITPALESPIVNPPATAVCNGSSAEFVATSTLGSLKEFYWYDAAVGGNLLAIGDTFNTGPLVQNGPTDLSRIYYVEAEDTNGCKSIRVIATLVFTPALTIPTVTPPVQTICNGDSTQFIASSAIDSTLTFYWYDAPSGGFLLYVGDTFNTGQIFSNGPLDLTRVYYVEAKDSTGCTSFRVPATVIITPSTDIPLVDPPVSTVCNGSTAQFVASSVLNTAKTFYWFDAASGGNLLFVGDTFITDTISQTSPTDLSRTYYVELEDSNGCRSFRVPAEVVIVPALEVPVVMPPAEVICSGQQATFVASTVTQTNVTFHWYNNQSGGTPIFTGDTFTTPVLVNNTLTNALYTYYVEAEDTNGCKSVRVPANVLVAPGPFAPVVTPPADVICNGQTATFVASSLNGALQYNWYDSLFGETPIFVGDTFITPQLVNTSGTDLLYNYFVESIDSNGCRSVRSVATAVIRPALDAPIVDPPVATVCNGTSAQFIASSLLSSGVYYNWYDSLIGGPVIFTGDTFVTDTLNNAGLLNPSRTYYVEITDSTGCTSLRTPAVAIIIPGLNTPVAAPVAPVCNGTSATLTATALLDSAVNFYWYDSLTATTPIFIGDTFVTDPLISSGPTDIVRTYFVETRSLADNCTSSRVPVIVTLVPALDVPIVNPPVATICSGTSASFTASSVLTAQAVFEWYDSIQGGNLLDTGSTFQTPTLSNNGTINLTEEYYVQLKDTNGCTSARVPAVVVITPALNVPTVSPPAQTICNGDSAQFVASSLLPTQSYRWYDSLSGGTLLYVGDTFITGQIRSNTSTDFTRVFSVEAFDSLGCTSARVPAVVLVSSNPDILVLIPATSTLCQGDSTVITAVSSMANLTIKWYLSANSDSAIYTGQIYRTGSLIDTTTYYVSSVHTVTGCESARYPVTINVNPILPLDGPMVSCERLTRDVIRFQWDAVTNADRYEISTDNGTTWQDPSSGQSGLFHDATRSDQNEPGATLIARAINRDNTCAPENGLNSLPANCSYTDEITPSFNPFNSFSPNKDGVNDVWVIGDALEFYPSNEVTIYSRWGKEVFKQKGYNNSTKAFTADGLDDGAYYYVIRIPEIDFVKTGYVMVIR